jgi:hypothetical protein
MLSAPSTPGIEDRKTMAASGKIIRSIPHQDSHMRRSREKLLIQSTVIWFSSAFLLFWLWDTWLLEGPHGPYRWVGMDFVPYWVGVREMLKGANPYTSEVTLKIQEIVYGGPAGVYDPMMFVYPAWSFLIVLPLTLLPLKWAVILYGSTLIVLLFLFLRHLSVSWTGTGYNLFLPVLLLGALPFVIISATKAQLGYLSLMGLYLASRWWKEKPLLAAVALGFALIKPTVTVLPVFGLLFWAFLARGWRFLLGFMTWMLLLLLLSMVAAGFWLPDYLHMLSIKGGMPVLWSVQILAPPWNFLYVLYFLVLLGYGLRISLQKGELYPWFSATVLVGMGLTPMRWIYDLFAGVLVPVPRPKYARLRYSLGLVLLSPWFLVFVPEVIRGEFAVIFFPLLWSLIFLLESVFQSSPLTG